MTVKKSIFIAKFFKNFLRFNFFYNFAELIVELLSFWKNDMFWKNFQKNIKNSRFYENVYFQILFQVFKQKKNFQVFWKFRNFMILHFQNEISAQIISKRKKPPIFWILVAVCRTVMRPSELFASKLGPILMEHNIPNVDQNQRHKWPIAALRKCLQELMSATPSYLLYK